MIMTAGGGPDDHGHVFGAGQGATPYIDVNGDAWEDDPWRVDPTNAKDIFSTANYGDNKETKYLSYLETVGLATKSDVTISGNAWVKGSVYGGSENGYVQHDTHVTIEGNCQIGNGYVQMDDNGTYLGSPLAVNRRYTDDEWSEGKLIMGENDRQALKDLVSTGSTAKYSSSLPECASWPYGKDTDEDDKNDTFAPYDKYAGEYDSKGGAVSGSDGHTFYGNVFGGGSGYYPYAAGKWHSKAGSVGGNITMDITGGHILTNVYGGNEMTNVTGDVTINFGGTATLGVPRTLGQIKNHPVACNFYGGGKGDQRVLFNKDTNVKNVVVNITSGTIYGSVFGGGEDGHVLANTTVTIGKDAVGTVGGEGYEPASGPTIGTWGTSGLDGNVFGGGRGFAGDAYTAGNVAGAVTMAIKGGTMLGSIYGGGRLASVGYGLYDAGVVGYGEMRADNDTEAGFNTAEFFPKGRGHVDITITGGTIGNTHEFIMPKAGNIPDGLAADFKTWSDTNWTTWKNHNYVPNTEYDTSNGRLLITKGGNVYAGGMGRFYKLNGTTPISTYNSSGALTSPIEWTKLGIVKSTKLAISGTGTWIMGDVYGGCEFGKVSGHHTTGGNDYGTEISITDATIGTEITGDTLVKTTVPLPEGYPAGENSAVKYTFGSVYGGGEGQETPDESADKDHGGDVTSNVKVTISGDTKVRASVFGGGRMAMVGGNTDITISGGEIGRNEVYAANEIYEAPDKKNPGYVKFGSSTMGNVYGAGMGHRDYVNAGLVKGNTNITIQETVADAAYVAEHGGKVGDVLKSPKIYHNVYGGGALASVGTFGISTGTGDQAHIPAGVPYGWADNTGTATVTITGGTIGISGRDNGMVNGSSRGDIEKPTGTPAVDRYDKVAWVKDAVVTIGEASGTSTGPHIKGSVYGGGENGHNSGNATVTVNRGTIGVVDTKDPWFDFNDDAINKKALITRGNVYGAGCGTDMYDSDGDRKDDTHNPKTGMVAGNTTVNINGGHIGHGVYGGGSMGAVGTVTSEVKHSDEKTSFALSWPYKFVFKEGTGKATINIKGGHVGTGDLDGGDVFGGSRGEAGDRYATAHLAYVGETEVNVDYTSPASESDMPNIKTDFTIPCVTGSVSGSGEDGFVYGDTHVTLNKGLIGHSLYGGGKGKSTYTKKLRMLDDSGDYDAKIYSLIAGKVFGNTYVTMKGGYVGRNVYGGGNMASVGKGNYAGGTDDYVNDNTISVVGYGEKTDGNLWDNVSEDSKAFLGSGKTTVNVISGTVGYIDTTDPSKSMKNDLPYGNVIGGSAGEAAPNITTEPRYEYSPAFFSGYVNETDVTIGGYRCKEDYEGEGTPKKGDVITAAKYEESYTGDAAKWEIVGPTILASVYGGGQDGHVRRDTKVTVLGGEIGKPFTSANITLLKTDNLDSPQWLHRGNVYGGGSGITKYKYDFNYNGKTSTDANGNDIIEDDEIEKDGSVKEEDYSNSSGSVTRFTEVNILGGIIHRNVYGGGSMGPVGAPNMGQDYVPYKPGQADIDGKPANGPGRQSMNTINIGGGKGIAIIGTPYDSVKGWTYNKLYGGEVYGACRGLSTQDSEEFSTSVWTQVNVKNGATIMGNVYGGGDNGMVKKDTEVTIGDKKTE